MYYFVITCAVGTVLQGAFYGMAFGWLSVAIAFVFVDSQLRSLRSYIDELSGLFGRKYMNYESVGRGFESLPSHQKMP